MNETDRQQFEPLQRALNKFDEPQPDGRPFWQHLKRDLAEAMRSWVPRFERAAADPLSQLAQSQQVLDARAVLHETHLEASELSLFLQAFTVRHPEARDFLQPRVGEDPDDHAKNLRAMRGNIDHHAPRLREMEIDIVLPRHLATEQVLLQLGKHKQAEAVLDAADAGKDGHQGTLAELRAEGAALQKQYNAFLRYYFPGNRALQLAYGLSERIAARRPKKAGPAPKPAAPAESAAPAPTSTTTPSTTTPSSATPSTATPSSAETATPRAPLAATGSDGKG